MYVPLSVVVVERLTPVASPWLFPGYGGKQRSVDRFSALISAFVLRELKHRAELPDHQLTAVEEQENPASRRIRESADAVEDGSGHCVVPWGWAENGAPLRQ